MKAFLLLIAMIVAVPAARSQQAPPSPAATVGAVVHLLDDGGSSPVAPASAAVVGSIQELPTWKEQHDPATGSGATSVGTMSIVESPSISGAAREFDTSYTNNGGELYYDDWGSDPNAHNFLYDGWVFMADNTDIINIEMDMNQVLSNGNTTIFGFQCDGWNDSWDYSENSGTVAASKAHWMLSAGTPCSPKNWTLSTWHHVQILYARDDNGNAIYESVWLDGVQQDIDATVPAAFALGWAQVLITNFQIDGGKTADGASTIYLDDLTISRW